MHNYIYLDFWYLFITNVSNRWSISRSICPKGAVDELQVLVCFIHRFREEQPRGNGRPELQLGRQGFLFFVPLFFFPHIKSSLTYLLCFVDLFHTCCSHSPVFQRTLSHEYNISYSHSYGSCFFAKRNCPCLGRSFACQKGNYNNNNNR